MAHVINGCGTENSCSDTSECVKHKSTPAAQLENHDYEASIETAQFLKAKIYPRAPKFALICGSGFGTVADGLTDTVSIDYKDIPGFPVSSVHGHRGRLVVGKLCGRMIACMQGRCHPYEGYDLRTLAFPVRVLAALGVKNLFLTNAAGTVNPSFNVGDIMIITDQIFLPGLAGKSPLVGPNDDRFGLRFPSATGIYDRVIRDVAKQAVRNLGIESYVREGTYTMCFGPQYETPAEARFLRLIGSDAIGMSTCHEAMAAKHCGMTVFGLSLITNKVVSDPNVLIGPQHEEVLEVGKQRAEMASKLFSEIMKFLNDDSN